MKGGRYGTGGGRVAGHFTNPEIFAAFLNGTPDYVKIFVRRQNKGFPSVESWFLLSALAGLFRRENIV